MTIIVGYLWVAPPKEATVETDGTISWSGARCLVGESERVAIEFAKGLAEATGERLIGVTVGDPLTATPQAANAGLACGIDQAVVVRAASAPGTAETAAAMAAVIRDAGDVSVVVIGGAASDSGTRMLGPYLGGLLGWPVLVDVMDADCARNSIRAVSETRGSPLEYRIDGHAVLSVAVASRKPRQMGLQDILSAAHKPSRIVAAEDLGAVEIESTVVADRRRLETGARQGRVIAGADAERASALLIAELAARGAL